MEKKKFLSISVIIPAHNEERNLNRLFKSLTKQSYPKNKIEYIVVDDSSTDNTVKLSRKFGAKVISVKTHDVELNKGIGLYASKNDLFYCLDADMEVFGTNFFQLLTKPFLENADLIGSFTKEFALEAGPPEKNSFLRFISYDPLQRDPTYAFFSPSIESTIIKDEKDYSLCRFIPGKIPPSGRTMYIRKKLLKTPVGNNKSFIDLESLELVSIAGFQLFAYVPKAQIRHYHADGLTKLIMKRPLRNLGHSFLGDQSGDYLPNIDKKHYLWFNSKDRKDSAKVIFWIIWANLFIPEFIIGITKSLFKRDFAFLWQPLTSIAITDAVIFGFLVRPEGRKLAKQVVKAFLFGSSSTPKLKE